jgi:hypothetical protein
MQGPPSLYNKNSTINLEKQKKIKAQNKLLYNKTLKGKSINII